MEPTPQEIEAARLASERQFLINLAKQPGITAETLDAIRQEVEAGVAKGIEQGIARALTPENIQAFWQGLGAVVHRQAKEKTGAFVLTGLSTSMKKLLWIALFGLAALMAFGPKPFVAAYMAWRSA